MDAFLLHTFVTVHPTFEKVGFPATLFINISSRDTGNGWTFTIEDNGIGIYPKQRDRVYVMFQRLNDRESYEGTGIGLAIAKKIIERHGGQIWLESEPGKGTTFFFTIPKAS